MLTNNKEKSELINSYFGFPIKKPLCLLPGNEEHEEQIRWKLENNDEIIAHTLNKFKSLRLKELQPRLQKK